MDPIDSGQGREKPSERCMDLTPTSKGRQRRKNPKYLDYETEDSTIVQSFEENPTRKGSEGEKAATQKSPARGRRSKAASKQTTSEENEATNKTPSETEEETVAEKPKRGRKKKTPAKKTPAKKTPAKKTPAKKTPAKKTPATSEDHPDGQGGGEDVVQQENGTPKPKRKYVKKQRVQEVEPDPTHEKGTGESQIEPEEEIEPGGRRRRGAAKAALKYLQNLAKEVFGDPSDQPDPRPRPNNDGDESGQKTPKGGKGRRGRKRKRLDSDAAEDEDFVPDVEEDQEEEEDEGMEEEAVDSDLDSDVRSTGRGPPHYHISKTSASPYDKPVNGLTIGIMRNVWDATETTRKFREEHFTKWVFPEWVPSTGDWEPLPQSELEKYLPQELQSAAFTVSREGLKKEETSLQRLSRFESVPAHPDRWDMMLYVGGPVWALEWCPTPDGAAAAAQYVALSSHRGMDDLHCVNQTSTGPGLVQLWDVGKLEYNSRPESQPTLSYGLAQDDGFIWQLRWCPAGGWEPPSSGRKAPFLPRLGLLAVATSNSVVTIYSLPHPEALNSSRHTVGKSSKNPPIYQAKGVVRLKLGSFKAPRHQMSGQVLSMDWLPEKPHNIMAIGFYDGVVGLWDLTTKSALLRLRESDGSMCLLPYRCLLAHDHAVRALAFCPASGHLLVTAGEDRYVKTWDLRRLYEPITVQKRYLTNEIYWPLNAPGLMMAQENAYVAKGSHGVHYFDHYMNSLLPIPRTSTVWSICYSEWLNSVVTADSLGEVIFSVLPQINYFTPYLKRTIERRFPIYLTSMVPCEATGEDVEEDGGAVEEQEGGGTEDPAPEGGNEAEGEVGEDKSPPLRFQTYKEAVKKYSLQHTDNDMRSFVGSEKRSVWKRMKDTELKSQMNLDVMPLAALHKVRFSPNMSSHIWVASGGQSGLVRFHCLKGMTSPHIKTMINKNQAQFNGNGENEQTGTEQL